MMRRVAGVFATQEATRLGLIDDEMSGRCLATQEATRLGLIDDEMGGRCLATQESTRLGLLNVPDEVRCPGDGSSTPSAAPDQDQREGVDGIPLTEVTAGRDGDDNSTTHSGLVFKRGMVYRGIYCPSLTNSFRESHLELAYQRYSHRQRQKSLIVVNVVDFLLKVILGVVWAFHKELLEAPTVDGWAWTVCSMAANFTVCMLGWWRCFANNYLHWAAICTWFLLNMQGEFRQPPSCFPGVARGFPPGKTRLDESVLVDLFRCRSPQEWPGGSRQGKQDESVLCCHHTGFISTGIGFTSQYQIWYVLFIVFVTYAMLPLPLRWCMILGCATGLIHLTIIATKMHIGETSIKETVYIPIANGILYLAVNFAGMYTKYLTDRGQRKAFLETHRSMETRCRTQTENDRQEKLLLSGEVPVTNDPSDSPLCLKAVLSCCVDLDVVRARTVQSILMASKYLITHHRPVQLLPDFVAKEMIRDIAKEEEKGAFVPNQFHKIYIHRYEDVSILFADIKGFTGTSAWIGSPGLGAGASMSGVVGERGKPLIPSFSEFVQNQRLAFIE
uniref:Adenylate cyclase N-terminal domain-containing protein n=1 Tax=Timema cristinae TaxID=61476 RepID=A0A7R9GQS6_TIMCR|nr:unnamed protein product [Timema cristinae]